MLFLCKLSGLPNTGTKGQLQPNVTKTRQAASNHAGAQARLCWERRAPYCVCGQKKPCSCKNVFVGMGVILFLMDICASSGVLKPLQERLKPQFCTLCTWILSKAHTNVQTIQLHFSVNTLREFALPSASMLQPQDRSINDTYGKHSQKHLRDLGCSGISENIAHWKFSVCIRLF